MRRDIMKSFIRRLTAAALGLAMICAVSSAEMLGGSLIRTSADPEQTIDVRFLGEGQEYYLDIDGKIKIADDVRPLTADAVQDGFGYPGTTSWYIVEGELTLDDRLSVYGNVNLILADGADLTINGMYRGLYFAQSYFSEPLTLTIYAQSYGSNMGKMTATSPFDGVVYSKGGTIVVNGGDVTFLGGTEGFKAGIAFSGSGNLIVNGGKFKAVSKDESSGCGIHYTENCSVTLGCSFPTDSIKIANFSAYEDGIVTVKAGQILTDGTNTYSGALTGTQLQTLSGKTLVPYKDTGDDITIDVSLIAPEGSALSAETATLTVDGVDYASQDGKFTLTDLPDGDYDMTVSAEKFVSRTYSATVSGGKLTEDVSFELHLPGDVDGNAKADLSDISAIKKHLKKTALLGEYETACAMAADGDQKITTGDVTAIKAHLKGTRKLW